MVEQPLPPVERVRPGLWSIPVPIPNNPLRYVLVYAFETDKGPYLVDAGWNTDDAYDVLCRGLVTAGFDIGDVQGVLVTHIHPDHYGLAGRIREASGAWVALHPADAALVHDRYEEPKPLVERMGELLIRAGAPEEEVQSLKGASMPVLPFVVTTHPDVLLEDGDKPEVPGWDLVSIWTPGHTAGHLCFYERDLRLMLSGDHILPRITPNISVNPQAENPLVDYLASLDKVGAYEADFVGLQTRVNELKAHHEERFVEVVEAIKSGCDTAWDITSRMHWSRPWDRINGWMRRAALGEALAHIRVLESRGVVRMVDGMPVRWEVVSAS